MHLASVVLPEPLRPTMATTLPGGHVERDAIEDGRRLGTAVAEADAAQRHAARERSHRPQRRPVAPLLGLVLKHVVQPVEQDVAALQVVPEQQQVADRRRGEGHERIERDQAADRQLAVEHLVRRRPTGTARGRETSPRRWRPRSSSP